ncbi:MAG: hypothetical protein IJC88_05575 [Oscillospiraceae bacterium]|nr:hypothetical protein [Oscillospiraceae bacterium]
MASGIEELVGMLQDTVESAWKLPFGSGKCLVERGQMLDLIDEIRANLPKDLEDARKVLETKTEIIAQAKREAESIQRAAENRARQLVSEEEITILARQKASEMTMMADTKSKELRRVANEYVEDVLHRLEDVMTEALENTRKSRQQFKSLSNKQDQ